jgi:hypothetical protein
MEFSEYYRHNFFFIFGQEGRNFHGNSGGGEGPDQWIAYTAGEVEDEKI